MKVLMFVRACFLTMFSLFITAGQEFPPASNIILTSIDENSIPSGDYVGIPTTEQGSIPEGGLPATDNQNGIRWNDDGRVEKG